MRKGERGTGIAASLLHDVTEHARDHGVLQLELAVNAENSAAMRFYQRHGFVEVGRIPNGFLGARYQERRVNHGPALGEITISVSLPLRPI